MRKLHYFQFSKRETQINLYYYPVRTIIFFSYVNIYVKSNENGHKVWSAKWSEIGRDLRAVALIQSTKWCPNKTKPFY